MRSTMGFMLLVLAVFLGYEYFFVKPKADQQPPPAQTQSQPAVPTSPVTPGQAQPAATSAPPSSSASAATPQVTASLETETTIENELYKIVFTNRGAQVKHWILKKYFDSAGKPLDMVQPEAAARFGFPLALFTYEPALSSQINQALYQVTVTGSQPTATGLLVAPAAVTFHYAANGLDVVKTFRFDSSYVVTVEAAVKQNGVPVRALVEWPAGLGDMEEFQQSSMIRSQVRTPSYFAWSLDGKQDSLARQKVSGNNTLNQPYQYAAIMDLYFAAAFLPDAPERTTVVTLHNTIDLPADPSDPNSKKTPADVLGLAVGDTSGDHPPAPVRRAQGHRAAVSIHAIGADGKPDGPSLEPLIQFGFWTFIAKPLYLVLRFMVYARHLATGDGPSSSSPRLFTLLHAAYAHHDDASRR